MCIRDRLFWDLPRDLMSLDLMVARCSGARKFTVNILLSLSTGLFVASRQSLTVGRDNNFFFVCGLLIS